MTRGQLLSLLRRALTRVDLRKRVIANLPARLPHGASNVYVIAIGKAAPAMFAGALARWGDAIRRGLVVTSDGTLFAGTGIDGSEPRIDVIHAAHPIPDRRSVVAAERCLALAKSVGEAKEKGEAVLLLVLVSGGASALVCSPAEGVSLRDKQAVTSALLASEASIQEINIVRKHLSTIKGGGLARAAEPATVLTLAASDVIDGAIGDVGSGPCIGDSSSTGQARRLLHRYANDGQLTLLPLARTGPVSNVKMRRLIASPEDLAAALCEELTSREAIGAASALSSSQASVDELAREYIALAKQMVPGTACVRAAEPSLDIPPAAAATSGRGGRSTHLATIVARALPRGVMFAALATDGVDGTSGTSGAIADAASFANVPTDRIDRALAQFDTGPLHLELGTAIPLGPSGHNLADLHVLIKT